MTPRFARGALRRYAIAAVGLTPYGHLADALFLIKEGQVAAYKADEGKACGKFLATMGTSQFFGESSLEKAGEPEEDTHALKWI